jgi:hypothetical protein
MGQVTMANENKITLRFTTIRSTFQSHRNASSQTGVTHVLAKLADGAFDR